jgi:hypothetical protein
MSMFFYPFLMLKLLFHNGLATAAIHSDYLEQTPLSCHVIILELEPSYNNYLGLPLDLTQKKRRWRSTNPLILQIGLLQ